MSAFRPPRNLDDTSTVLAGSITTTTTRSRAIRTKMKKKQKLKVKRIAQTEKMRRQSQDLRTILGTPLTVSASSRRTIMRILAP